VSDSSGHNKILHQSLLSIKGHPSNQVHLENVSFLLDFFFRLNQATGYASQHLMPIPSQDKLGALQREGHPAQKWWG